jgi:cold shock CspA family protein
MERSRTLAPNGVFIIDDETGQEVFLHCHNLSFPMHALAEGDLVDFTVRPSRSDNRGRPEAVNVKLIKRAVPTHPKFWRA